MAIYLGKDSQSGEMLQYFQISFICRIQNIQQQHFSPTNPWGTKVPGNKFFHKSLLNKSKFINRKDRKALIQRSQRGKLFISPLRTLRFLSFISC